MSLKGGNIVMIRAHIQQGMESGSKNYWLIYAAATVIMTWSCGVLFSVAELI